MATVVGQEQVEVINWDNYLKFSNIYCAKYDASLGI